MYELLMTVFGVLFVALIAARAYHVHLARVAKVREAKLARIRATVAWLRQNVHLPKFILRRKERQEARAAKWTRLAEEKERKRALGKVVKRILDPYWNLDVAIREETSKRGKIQKTYPLTSDNNLVRR